MNLDLATIAIVFAAIFVVELPDKTFIATLVLATRFRPLFVWIGVSLAFLVQTWAQRRTSANRTALVFTLEPVWAAIFGFTLAGDRLGALGWSGCGLIMAGIVVSEPAAAEVLGRLVRRPGRPPGHAC